MAAIKNIMGDSIYGSGIWLIAASLATAFLGFFFWQLTTGIFTPEQVGLASALIASGELIMIISLLGLDYALIRYLPKAKHSRKIINTSFSIAAVAAIIFSLIFILGINTFSPKLSFLAQDPYLAAWFIIFVLFYAFSVLIGSVFTALKKARLVFAKESIFGIAKITSIFILISLGALGIFYSWAVSMVIAFAASILIFKKMPKFSISTEKVKSMLGFSITNYFSHLFLSAPGMIFPIMIANLVSLSATAYFYISWIIGSLIFIIPISVSRAFLSQGTGSKQEVKKNIHKSLKICFALIIPIILIMLPMAEWVLLIFGKDYSINSLRLLQLIIISSIPFTLNIIYSTLKNIQHNLKAVLMLSFSISAASLALGYFFIGYGIIMVGFAWLISQTLAAIYSGWRLYSENA